MRGTLFDTNDKREHRDEDDAGRDDRFHAKDGKYHWHFPLT
jgi:hypothetical protein